MEFIAKEYQINDTIVALATPNGYGAISIVRVSGRQCYSIVGKFCHAAKSTKKIESHKAYFTKYIIDGVFIDEVLLLAFKRPNSYTGEDAVEISCHASPFIVEKILSSLIEEGARLASKGEFTFRAFLNKKMDLSQAEAVADLISSKNKSQHKLAIHQMRGGYSDGINTLRQELLDFASLLELELDFGEEDVEFADRDQLLSTIRKIRGRIEKLINSFQYGNVIKNGVPVVIFGRPNAGKSSLLNALLKEERAIVSDIEGTTRDTVEENLVIQGTEYRFIDTAGIRDARDKIEAIGIERAKEKIQNSSILIYIFDAAQLSAKEVLADLKELLPGGMTKYLVVANKMDINTHLTIERFLGEDSVKYIDNWLPISAKNNMNIEFLKDKIHDIFGLKKMEEEDILISNVRHLEALKDTDINLSEAEQGMISGLSSDLVALHLRYAIEGLASITGRITNEELLGNIFGNFCIGK